MGRLDCERRLLLLLLAMLRLCLLEREMGE
jgi:hypothetical protein